MSIERVGASPHQAEIEIDPSPEAGSSAPFSAEEIAAGFAGDPQAQIAAMLLRHAHDRRALSKQMRQAEERSLVAAEKQEVKLMREQAGKEYAAAVARGLGQLAVGAAQAGVGGATMVSSDPQATQAKGATFTGGAQVFSAGAELYAAGKSLEAGELRADATEVSAKARQITRRMEDLRSDEGAATALADKALEFIKESKEAEAQAYRNALFRG